MNNKSSKDTNWAKLYDVYEIEFRENYQLLSKFQNDSHWVMLENFIKKTSFPTKRFSKFGFGAGLTLRYASKIFDEVYGFDISPKNVEKTNNELLSEGYKNIKLFCQDILEKNKEFENYFDVISFIHGIEHFSDDDYPILFENIKFYLKKGGIFSGALPNKLPFTFRICPNCNHKFEIDGHLSIFDKTKLKNLFELYDLKVIKISDFNYSYYFKFRGLTKTLYHLFINKILKKDSKYQLEFIVENYRK